jgi:peptidyl-prolyl cis-trans isomerase C
VTEVRPVPARLGAAAHARRQRVLGVLLFVVGLSACPSDPRAPRRPPVAVVGATKIDEGRVLAVLAQRGVARVTDPAARAIVTRRIVDDLVDEELVLQAAAAAGISVAPEAVEREVRARAEGFAPGTFQRMLTVEQLTIDAFREGVRRRLVADSLLRSHFAALPAVTEDDVAARYQARREQLTRPAEVRVRQVLVRTQEEARHLLDQIRAGSLTVEQAAQRFSSGLEADQGGDLGWFARGELPDAFDVCFSLDKGAVSDVVPSDYGFHVFQVIDARDARTEDLATVRERLFDDIVRERQSAAADLLLADLRQRTPVVVDEQVLDHIVTLLPPAPVTPAEVFEQGGRALDSHDDGSDAVPPLRRE